MSGNLAQALREDIKQSKEFILNRTNSLSVIIHSQNALNLQSSKSLACVERIQECKTFGKYLYERKQYEEAQKQFEEALKQFKDLHMFQTMGSNYAGKEENKGVYGNTGST